MRFLHRHRLSVVLYPPQQPYRINVVLVQHSQWNTYVRQATKFTVVFTHCCGCAHPIIVFYLLFFLTYNWIALSIIIVHIIFDLISEWIIQGTMEENEGRREKEKAR
jgi:hypothetical protein